MFCDKCEDTMSLIKVPGKDSGYCTKKLPKPKPWGCGTVASNSLFCEDCLANYYLVPVGSTVVSVSGKHISH